VSIGSISSSALSAVAAYGTSLNVTANNVANMNTSGFTPSRTIINEDSNGGVRVTVNKGHGEEVDIAKEMVDTMIEKTSIQANIKSLQAEDQIIKSLIDIKL